MEEKLDIIEILKDKTDLDNNEGFCIIKDDRIITLNVIFKEHSNLNHFPEESSVNIFSDFIVEKYKQFLSENVL
ncbi:MAG: hypothetical protein N2319_06220 [Candidatus Kapabacteria bacterium]|nr:hypothetical protein [Candidatus Kapabacteria bacterium]